MSTTVAEQIAALPVGAQFHFAKGDAVENITWTKVDDTHAYANHAEAAFDLPLNSNNLFPEGDDDHTVEDFGTLVEGPSPIELKPEDVSELDKILIQLGL